jgi:hypothetical protein
MTQSRPKHKVLFAPRTTTQRKAAKERAKREIHALLLALQKHHASIRKRR